MKKILSLFLVFTLVFSLSACGSNSKEKDNETESQTETVQEVDLTTCVTGLRDRVVEVNTKPDWMDGVKFDEKYVKSVKSDDSKVDMTKAGEYQLTYNITGVESKAFIAKDVKVIKKVTVTVKEKMTEEEKASEEQKTAEAQKQDVKPVIEEKKSSNSGKNSSSSNSSNNSSSSSNNGNSSSSNKPSKPSGDTGNNNSGSSKPAHQHDWQPVYTTVHHEAQYRNEPVYKDEIVYEDRPVYKWQAYWTCNECGQRFENEKDVARHALMICGGGWTAHEEKIQTGTEQVQVGTNKVQIGTNQVLVKEAWDEKVPNGQSCSCGARK